MSYQSSVKLTQHFTQICIVQIRILVSQFLPFHFRPHHKCVHWTADSRLFGAFQVPSRLRSTVSISICLSWKDPVAGCTVIHIRVGIGRISVAHVVRCPALLMVIVLRDSAGTQHGRQHVLIVVNDIADRHHLHVVMGRGHNWRWRWWRGESRRGDHLRTAH